EAAIADSPDAPARVADRVEDILSPTVSEPAEASAAAAPFVSRRARGRQEGVATHIVEPPLSRPAAPRVAAPAAAPTAAAPTAATPAAAAPTAFAGSRVEMPARLREKLGRRQPVPPAPRATGPGRGMELIGQALR